ncbi:MAG: hypothetical protein MRZ79_02865 [Bacteroidia bacterium]|nr:hypothetical protein [Bacteroidia bacterium]
MDILEKIIEHLTSDEVRRFKILSNRFKADEEKKLLILFDAIRSGDFKDTELDVVTQLYGSVDSKAKNSYYRLRNKLLQNLEKSLLFYHFNYKNAIEALANIQLSMLLRERGLYREAYYQLKKAEKAALDQDQFNVLEVVYDEMVKLAMNFEVDIEAILERRRQNLKKTEILRANSEVLGTITQQLSKRNFARSKRSPSVIQTLESIRSEFEEHAHIFRSPQGQVMIMNTVIPILIQKGAYKELIEYSGKMLGQFQEEKLFNQENHSVSLRLRIYRINSLLKLLQLDSALAELEHFWEELEMYERQNFNEYAFHYYSDKIIALKLMGRLSDSSKVLDQAFSQKEILKKESNEQYLYISLADQYFCQKNYGKAVEVLEKLIQKEYFPKIEEEIRFYVKVFRLVNLFEARRFDEVESSYKGLKKVFRTLMKDEDFGKAVRFLEILQRLNTAEKEGKKVFLKAAYKGYSEAFGSSEIGGNEIFLYELYLQSKLNPQLSYYDLLLQKVQRVIA